MIVNFFHKILLFLGAVLLAAPLLLMAYIGSLSRFMADDYWYSNLSRGRSIWQASIDFYMNWNCRLGANVLDFTSAKIGLAATFFLPIVFLSVWVGSVIFLAHRIFRAMGVQVRFAYKLLFSLAVIYTTLTTTPDIEQSFYWAQNSRCVIPPLILLNIMIALFLSTSIPWPACMIVAFIASLFHEVFSVLQIITLICACLYIYQNQPYTFPQVRKKFTGAILGSTLGFMVLWFSPGRLIRASHNLPHSAPITIVAGTLTDFSNYVLSMLSAHHLPVLLSFALLIYLLFSSLSENTSQSKDLILRRVIVTCAFSLCVILLAAFSIGWYATTYGLPPRTVIIPHYFVIGSILFVSSYTGWRHPIRIKQTEMISYGCAVIIVVVCLVEIVGLIDQKREYAKHAQIWDVTDAKIRQAARNGEKFVNAPWFPNPAGLTAPRPYPEFEWVNRDMNIYHGIEIRFFHPEKTEVGRKLAREWGL